MTKNKFKYIKSVPRNISSQFGMPYESHSPVFVSAKMYRYMRDTRYLASCRGDGSSKINRNAGGRGGQADCYLL